MEIIKLQDAVNKSKTTPKVLVYGQPGTGKTPMLGTIPGKTLLLSAESGLLSLDGCPADIDVVAVKGIDTLMQAYKLVSSPTTEYTCVALDSLSEIAEITLVEEKAKVKDPRMAYGSVVDEVIGLVKAFRDIPHIACVMIAKEEETKQPSGLTTYGPMMPGNKLGGNLPYYFDEVLRLIRVQDPTTKQTMVRCFAQAPDGSFKARDRSGKLDLHEEPDFGVIFGKISE